MASNSVPAGTQSTIKESSTAQSSACALCSTSFASSVQQRTHVKSPWHIYNLKRRIATLPPISLSTFETQILAQPEEEGVDCSICQVTFQDVKTYQIHLKSRSHLQKISYSFAQLVDYGTGLDDVRHLASVASQIENLNISDAESEVKDEEGEEESTDDSGEEEYPTFDGTICLFCPHTSSNLETTIAHMQSTHALSIPALDSLTNRPTFFAYLHTLIEQFNQCLLCSRIFGDSEKARQHMRDKAHCGIDAASEDFSEFWEEEADHGTEEERQEGILRLEIQGEKIALLGRKTVRHRLHRGPRRQRNAALTDTEAGTDTDVAVRRRDENRERSLIVGGRRSEMGMIGLSEQAQKGLRAMEKKMVRVEMRTRNEVRARTERIGNRQKTFRADVPGARPNG